MLDTVLVVVVQSLSPVQLFVIPWTAACQVSLSFTVSQSLLKLMSIDLVMPSNPSHPLLPFFSCTQCFPASGSFPKSQLVPSDGQNIGGGCYFLLQGIFLTQGLNPCLLHWQVHSLLLNHQGRFQPSLRG